MTYLDRILIFQIVWLFLILYVCVHQRMCVRLSVHTCVRMNVHVCQLCRSEVDI